MPYCVEQRVAEALARRAGKLMLDGRTDFVVDLKGKNDLVTNVDRSIELFLRDEFAILFPDDGFFGEEYGAQERPLSRQWVVDPIDGTMNFAHGIPMSCVAIALLVEGCCQVGVIYEPYRDELFSARLGYGADMNGAKLGVSATIDLADAVVATGFPPLKSGDVEDNLGYFAKVTRASRGVRRLGSAAIDLAYVAAGRLEGFWEYHLNPWDTLAGMLLVREAGGAVTDRFAAAYTGFEPCVVATNGHIHNELIGILEK